MQGELSKATSELEEVLRRNSNRFDVYMLLGPLYERQERYEAALRTYERLERQVHRDSELAPTQLPAPIFAAMARLHLLLENVEEAKRYAQKGVATDANSWRSYYILGNVYAAMNQLQKQVEHYTNALKAIDAASLQSPDATDLHSVREQIQNELEQLKK